MNLKSFLLLIEATTNELKSEVFKAIDILSRIPQKDFKITQKTKKIIEKEKKWSSEQKEIEGESYYSPTTEKIKFSCNLMGKGRWFFLYGHF